MLADHAREQLPENCPGLRGGDRLVAAPCADILLAAGECKPDLADPDHGLARKPADGLWLGRRHVI